MFSTRPLPPLPPFEFVLPMDECASSEDLNSTSSESSPSPSVFDMKFETPFHMETSGEHDDDLWVSILGDKGLISNASNCLPELDSDEGYIDHSSTYSSGVLSPDVDFLGLKSFEEFDYNTHKDLQTPSFQNFDFLEKSPQKTECLSKISGSEEYAFDDCCLLSLPPSPEATNCLDVLFAFPSISDALQPSRSPYSCEQYTNFDKKGYQETSTYADDFDASCFERDLLDTHKLSNDDDNNNTPSNNDALVNADLLNLFFSDNRELNAIHTRHSSQSSANRQSDKSKESSNFQSSAREDHGYAAKLPSCSSNKLKKRGLSREVSRASNTSSAKLLHLTSSPSVLEMFLTSNRTLDPNKGSNAALASEMKRYERQTGLKSDRLLKKLLTNDFDRRRNDARH